jgi:hypothetical protein
MDTAFRSSPRGKESCCDFHLCEETYVKALEYYFEQGYSLCVMGDTEELWEEFPRIVIRNNSASFIAERRFHEAGRYRYIWGNHDDIWGNPALVQKFLQPMFGGNSLMCLRLF